jgi:putative FmdB family regulatory protein
MPIYEYRCAGCRRRVSVLFQTLSQAQSTAPACPECGSTELRRLVSRFVARRSEESRLDDLESSALDDFDESDPSSVARFAERMKSELGDDAGEDFDEVIEEMRSGTFSDDDLDGGPEDDGPADGFDL